MKTVPNSTFLFDHIPKTGGTALRAVFEGIFGPDQVSPHSSAKSEAWARQTFLRHRMITGHFLSLPGEAIDDGRIRLTVLRHPIDRAVSEYYWFRHDADQVSGGKLGAIARANELYDYLRIRDETSSGSSRNYYVRHFAGKLSRDLVDDTQMLSLAKQSLSFYDFVGIYEYFSDTVDVFCCEYGLPPVIEIPRLNATSSRAAVSELDRKTTERLMDTNGLDIELYEFAKASFQARKRKVFHQIANNVQRDIRAREPIAGDGEDFPTGPRSSSPRDLERLGSRQAKDRWIRKLGSRWPWRLPRGGGSPAAPEVSQERPSPQAVMRPAENFGNRQVEFISARIFGEVSDTRYVSSGEMTTISLVLYAHVSVPDLTVGIGIADSMGEIVFGTNTCLLSANKSVSANQYCEVRFRFRANLNKHYYFLNASAHTGTVHTDCCFHWWEHITDFDVVDFGVPEFEGYVRLEPNVEWREVSGDSAEVRRHAEAIAAARLEDPLQAR